MGGEIVAPLAAVCVIGGFALDRMFHPGRKVAKRLEQFFEDWNGEPERTAGHAVIVQRRAGVLERLTVLEASGAATSQAVSGIEEKLNGGGLGSQLTALDDKFSEHIETADTTRGQILDEITATKEQVGETQRFVYRLAQSQERLETTVADVDSKVTERLFQLEEAERGHRAALHEIGMDVDEAGDG